MLNRTNGTLSANTNRLNLGTRSLALVAGFNVGEQTLRVRHAHPSKRKDSARIGSAYRIDPPIMGGDPVPAVPGSSPCPAWPRSAAAGGARVTVVAEAPPVERQVVSTDPSFRAGRSRSQAQTWPRHEQRGSHRSPVDFPGSRRGTAGMAAADASCRMTAAPVATLPVASGG